MGQHVCSSDDSDKLSLVPIPAFVGPCAKTQQNADQELTVSEIRVLYDTDFSALSRIWSMAYPGAKIITEDERERFREGALRLHKEDPTANFYGLFRDGHLQGIMCLYDFTMNFLGVRIPAGGVGQVAVDLLHKKEHVAKEMMAYSLQHYRERDVPFVALYPFRPDFYAEMNFGYGPKMSQYRVDPAAFPKGSTKEHVRYLGLDDKQAIADCYNRFAGRNHGMMYKTEREMRSLFRRQENQIVGVYLNGELRGYLVYTFEQGDDFITNDLHIQEWIYETPEALSELSTFLYTQADQIRRVIVDTHDEDFHHLLLDPRDGSGNLIPSVYHQSNAQGVGLMYRVVDVPGIFDLLAEHNFGGQTCTLKLAIEDSFLPDNAGSILLRFEGGLVQQLESGNHDVKVRMAIEDFSSLLAGTVAFRSLHNYGRAQISDTAYVDTINRLFTVEHKPVCMSHF
jgi:predicted acetyltransferase